MKPKYYAGGMPYHKHDREYMEAMMRATGRELTIPEPTPAHIPVPCSGCGMALSFGSTMQERMRNTTEELVPICPMCMASVQKITKEQVTVENVEHPERDRIVLCSCGTALKHGERCSKCWREAKAYGS